MLKAAQKSYKNNKLYLDTYAHIQNHVGYLKLNREHRYNTLTSNYIRNIKRSLDTLNIDEVVKVIYMAPANGEHFSNGTDFRTILHHKNEGKVDKVVDYLNDLYNLQIQASKINKPLIGVAPGHSFNSGATFLQATGLPIVTPDSKVSYNETSFGFVPHGGSTYYLSRLPGEIGTFLAITGLPITGVDAIDFGIADEMIHYSKAYEEEVSNMMYAFDWPLPNYKSLTNNFKDIPLKQKVQKRNELIRQQEYDEMYKLTRQSHENSIFEEFYEPKDNVPSRVANSDYQHKQMMKRYNERFMNEEGYLDGESGTQVYSNYYWWVMNHLKSHSGHEYPHDPQKSFIKNVGIINRCFYPNSVDQIMENLKREDSPFAKLCLQKMQTNSLLSMKLALKMVRNAKSLDFKGALQQEMNVALNKIQDKEFDLGVSEVLMKPSRFTSNKNSNPGFSTNISDDQVQSYFAKNKWSDGINIDVVEKAMLPTRFYYDKFSDQVRLWINESTTPQEEVREYFNEELQEALRDQGIDVRDRALTIESARSQLYQRELWERRKDEWIDRVSNFVTDDKLITRYHDDVISQVEKIDNNPGEYYKMVNNKIQEIFENAYLEKLQLVFDKSKEAHDLEKRRMFIRFKKFLFQSRILTFANEEVERSLKILSNLPFKQLHFTEQWNKQTFREMEHPELYKSPLYQLAKVVGRTNLTPPELAREYLTNQNFAKQTNLYTFNKEELLKLRKDLLENPDKYEKLFRKDTGLFDTKDERFDQDQRKRDSYVYWYRVLHQGITPDDNLPFTKLAVVYKEFVDNVEMNLLNTLKMTVQRLILDFENQEGVNEIVNYSQSEKESKYAALRRLLSLVTMQNNEQEKGNKKKDQGEKNELSNSFKPISDIKKYVNKLIEEDQHVSKLIPKDIDDNNPLIRKYKNQVLNDLYSLIEFVLLNKTKPDSLPKDLLQERLASLANPSNANQRKITSLRIIDNFLNEKNGEQLVKEAIRISKPFFFSKIFDNLEFEAQKILDGFQAPATCPTVLTFYLMNLWYPEFRDSQIVQRILQWNENSDHLTVLEQMFPLQSQRYTLKNFINLMGTKFEFNNDMSVSEKEKILEQQTKEQYETMNKLKAIPKQREDEFHKQVLEAREKFLKTVPNNLFNPDKDIDAQPVWNLTNFNGDELESLLTYVRLCDEIVYYIQTNIDDIQQNTRIPTWLHIFAHSIKDYGMDMNGLLRECLPASEFLTRDLLTEMQNKYAGNKQLTWDNFGDYAVFISGLFDQAQAALQNKDSHALFDTVNEYMVKQMDILDHDLLAKNQSLYQLLNNNKKLVHQVGNRTYDIKKEIKEFQNIQSKISKYQKSIDQIKLLSENAPKNTREMVQNILSSNSEYLNYSKLEEMLLKKQYDKINVNALVDSEKIINDVSKGKIMKDWVKNYLDTKLDVISIAQVKEIIKNTDKSDLSNIIDPKLRQQIDVVFNYINDQLKHVPHSRRQSISLGEFLKRHQFVNSASVEDFANEIIKNKIKEIMGAQGEDIQSADIIDWELAGVRTNPSVHQRQEENVKQALQDGKGIDNNAMLKEYLENNYGGKSQDQPQQIMYTNEVTGQLEVKLDKDLYLENVLRQARESTKFRPDMEYIRNHYENQIIECYAQSNFNQQEIEYLIQRYTEIRLRECMLNPEFATQVKSNNGHYYVKMLKEQIVEELKLNQSAKMEDFDYGKNFLDTDLRIEFDGKYNLSHLNNENAIGYDNLEKRAANPDQNREIAHESIFDKLIADYFLQKRGQFVANNELLDQLSKQFSGNLKFPDGHPSKTTDPYQVNESIYPIGQEANLAAHYLLQNRQKDIHPTIKSWDFTEMMELDIITNQALQNNKNGLADRLRSELPAELQGIPEYFLMFDVRKPPQKYVDDKVTQVLQEIFNVRKSIEKTLTRNELIAYDKVLLNYLEKDVFIPKVRREIENDFNSMIQMKQIIEKSNEGKKNEELQYQKTLNDQADFNRSIKNEDAYFKFYAYSAMLEKQRREDVNKTRKDDEIAFGQNNFFEFYKSQLKLDAQRDPREINPNDYKPKKGIDQANVGEGFRTTDEREADYFREFEIFKENKKEQQERNMVYYILEQYFAKAKENQDPMNKAQQSIVEYFSNPENTFFFEKNKIQ